MAPATGGSPSALNPALIKSFSQQLKHPHDNYGPVIEKLVTAFSVLCFVTVFLRFVSRKMLRQQLLADDWFCLLGLVLSFSLGILALKLTHIGFGRHTVFLSVQELTSVLKGIYIFQIIYILCNPIIKFSILFLYMRIFNVQRSFDIGAKVLGVVIILWTITYIFRSVFVCSPIHTFWNRLQPGHCENKSVGYTVQAILNSVLDFAVLLLPMPIVWKLNTNLQTKILITLTFMVGGLACTASFFRIYYTARGIDLTDPTRSLFPPGMWAVLECDIGIICCCLPILRPIFVRFISKPFSSGFSSVRKATKKYATNSRGDGQSKSTNGSPNRDNVSPRPIPGEKNERGKRSKYEIDTTGTDSTWVDDDPISPAEGGDTLPKIEAVIADKDKELPELPEDSHQGPISRIAAAFGRGARPKFNAAMFTV